MKSVGVDLRKQGITLCIADHTRTKLDRQRLDCDDDAGLVEDFRSLAEFQAVVEATASYEWFVKLIASHARRWLMPRTACSDGNACGPHRNDGEAVEPSIEFLDRIHSVYSHSEGCD